MIKIYWAAPLHDKSDQERNAMYVEKLRQRGHKVYSPQEHGVWEDFPDPEAARRFLYMLDIKAMREADVCIGCCGDKDNPRGPSEGMLWEMGYMAADNKTVLLYNEDNYWKYNLMPEFGATRVFANFDALLDFLDEEQFK